MHTVTSNRPRGNEAKLVDPVPKPTDPFVDDPGPNFVRTGIWFYGAMAIVAVLWRTGMYSEPIFFATQEDAATGPSWGNDVVLGLFVGFVFVALSNLATRFTEWGENLARAMADALGPISTADAILLAFASGLAEEMLFRGALQPRVGLVVATVLFGIVHFVPRREFLPWTVFALVVGYCFAVMFEYTGNLIAPVVAHTVINGINLPTLVKRYGTPEPDV
jgi:membrane protease YdiL (CAAX protease family)